jgi:exosome complex component RRP42
MFNDDWEAANPLYPAGSPELPPITLLVVGVGGNIIFDPSKEELAVADAVLAISLAKSRQLKDGAPEFSLLSLRTVDPPSRMTAPGLTDAQSAGGEETASKIAQSPSEGAVWAPPSGGMKRGLVSRAVGMCLGKEGVANEVLTGLQNFLGTG